jgi:hypothetical protein
MAGVCRPDADAGIPPGHVLLAEMTTPQILEIGAEIRVDQLTERFRSGT